MATVEDVNDKGAFKELIGKEIKKVPGSENVKKTYKKELLKEIATNEDYQKPPREKKEKEELKEKMKTPEIEPENYKIDVGMSKKEKLAQGWEEKEKLACINGTETRIKILRKKLAPGAFVREYQADEKMPKHLVGEQLFNWNAVCSLGLQDRLPRWEDLQSMRGNTQKEKDDFLKKNFTKNGKKIFTGYSDPMLQIFDVIGSRASFWSNDKNSIKVGNEYMLHDDHHHGFCHSLRLSKAA